jgi:hypothetical protein
MSGTEHDEWRRLHGTERYDFDDEWRRLEYFGGTADDPHSPEKGLNMYYYKNNMHLDVHGLELDCAMQHSLPWILKYCKHGLGRYQPPEVQKNREGYKQLETAIKDLMVSICTKTFHKCEREAWTMRPEHFNNYELDFRLRQADLHVERIPIGSTPSRYVQNLYCDIMLNPEGDYDHLVARTAWHYSPTYILSVCYNWRGESGTYDVRNTSLLYKGLNSLNHRLCIEHSIQQLKTEDYESEMEFGKPPREESERSRGANPEDIGGGAAGGGAAGACIVPQLQNPYCLDKN